ncbi:regulatory iron-sulfur-containing complex subunit RicT [Tritonibacter mobilis]|nr:regulatory iron-sulfur-containing complex subunit RicT [Tritonibacter mobilis]
MKKLKKIYRKASQKDIDIWQSARDREDSMKVRAREIAIRLKLQMKISDIEFQGDGSKATFYYTAEDRVDFRQLIKEFAHEFSTRIEMRQVGFRQEAARLGGIGSCGRELCCSTWLTDFRSVNTSAARYQQLSLNPQKLAGQCGKLKCCLNYELDSYVDALKSFPKTEVKLKTEKGTAVCQKIDIFKGHLWYAYEGEWMNWHKITTEDANEIIALNKKEQKVQSLEDYALELLDDTKNDFENVVGQDSLTRFDQPKRPKKKRKNTKRKPKSVAPEAKTKSATTAKPKQRSKRKPPRKKDQETIKTVILNQKRMKNLKLIFLIFFVFLFSCSSDQVFDQYKTVQGTWEQHEHIEFSIPQLDSLKAYNLFINVRNTNEYPFSNLFLIGQIRFPNGKVISDTLEYELAYPDGSWMGTGITDLKENKLWYKENVKFIEKGEYIITLEHAMRKNGEVQGVYALDGVTDVGLRIEHAKNP